MIGKKQVYGYHHDWFAWYPVKLPTGQYAWLETVLRFKTPYYTTYSEK